MSTDFRVVFVLYPGVTQLDFTGPFEVFARLPHARCTLASVAGGMPSSLALSGSCVMVMLLLEVESRPGSTWRSRGCLKLRAPTTLRRCT
jgi:putative intracellular protease/amidase